MIIFLYGQDSYSLIKYVDELVARYRKKYPDSFNLHKFDLEEDNADEIRNAVKGTSFFDDVKFIVAKNPFAKPGIEKTIKENSIAKEKETVLLLYQTGTEEELKKKDQKLFELLRKESQTKEFKTPTAQALNKFAANYTAKNKIPVPKKMLDELIKEKGVDFWRLKNELDKIAGFIKSEKKLSDDGIKSLVNFSHDQNIFALIDAAFTNRVKAITLFENYLEQGGDPLYLISMIAFQLKNMLIVREQMDKNLQYGQILKKTKMHPFLFKKIYEAAKNYEIKDLKETFRKTADFEIAFKNGQAEPKDIFFKIFL